MIFVKTHKGFASFSSGFPGRGGIVLVLFILNTFCSAFSAEEFLKTFFLSPNSRFEYDKSQVLEELNDAQALADQIMNFKAVPPSVAPKTEDSPLPSKGKSKAAAGWIPTYTGYSSGGLEVDRARIYVPSYNYFIRHVVDTERKVMPSTPGSETRTVKDFDVDDGVLLPEIVQKSSGSKTRNHEYQPSGEIELFLKRADEKTALLLSMEPREILLKKRIWYEALQRIETEMTQGMRNPYLTEEDKSRLKILKNYFMILLDKSDLALASREAMMKNPVMISG